MAGDNDGCVISIRATKKGGARYTVYRRDVPLWCFKSPPLPFEDGYS